MEPIAIYSHAPRCHQVLHVEFSSIRENQNEQVNLGSLCITHAPGFVSHPQGHLKLDSGAGARVPEGEALSQRHVLLGQQDAQRHRQVSQRALVLVIFYLREKQGVRLVGGAAREKRSPYLVRGMMRRVLSVRICKQYLQLQLLPPGVVDKE